MINGRDGKVVGDVSGSNIPVARCQSREYLAKTVADCK